MDITYCWKPRRFAESPPHLSRHAEWVISLGAAIGCTSPALFKANHPRRLVLILSLFQNPSSSLASPHHPKSPPSPPLVPRTISLGYPSPTPQITSQYHDFPLSRAPPAQPRTHYPQLLEISTLPSWPPSRISQTSCGCSLRHISPAMILPLLR